MSANKIGTCLRNGDSASMKYVVLISLVACGAKKVVPPAPPFVISGTIQSLSTGAAVSCATPLTVKLYDVTSFLLEPGSAPALATCNTDASASFTCSDPRLGDVSTAVIALIDDADNAKGDCIATTVTIAAGCSPTCAKSTAGADGTLTGADLAPIFVPPAHFLESIDAAAPSASLGSLVDSGAILNLVVDKQGMPLANALPWLPVACDAKLDCRAVILTANGPLATGVTDRTGLWLAQVVSKNHTSAVQIDITDPTNAANGYGAVDCSATPVCYQPLPGKPLRSGELGAAISGVVTMNFVTETAAINGVCPVNAAATKAGDGARVACP